MMSKSLNDEKKNVCVTLVEKLLTSSDRKTTARRKVKER